MSEEKGRPDEEVQPRKKGTDEKVGHALGKAFGRLRRTRIWKDTSQAYQEGLEGKQ